MTTITRKSDAALQADVLSELRWDTRVGATDIGVGAREGVVTLTGAVDSWARRMAAQQAAHRVAGVLDVANDLEVRPSGPRARSDADLARAARQSLEWDARVPAEKIQLTVSKGAVTLEGTVDFWSERADAEDAVHYLEGVTAVRNAIEVRAHFVAPSAVRLAIAEALRRHAMRETRHIELGVEDGVVTLSGTVGSWSERRAAVGAAGAIHGVRSVVDRLRVDQPMSL